MSANKPLIVLLSFGGTIAGKGETNSTSAEYEPGKLSIESIIESVPGLSHRAYLEGHNLAAQGSPDISAGTIKHALREIQRCQKDDKYTGIVVTTGTDTMCEFAWALSMGAMNDCAKPIVVTGAMRPATALSPDGPKNLFDAVIVACDPQSRDRGTLAVMGGCIFLPPFFLKTDTCMLDAFTGGEAGPVGRIDSGVARFFFEASRPNVPRVPLDDLSGDEPFPCVKIEYGQLGHTGDTIDILQQQGWKGLILAGMGAGSWTTEAGERFREFHATMGTKIPIVACRRTAAGFVGRESIFGLGNSCIRAGPFNPEQCAVMLQFALANGWGSQQIEQCFHGAGI